jgi:TRAP-type C4-dicarboxylate transport system substrate-binding protein
MTTMFPGVLSGAFDMTSLNVGSWGEYSNAFAELNVPFLIKDAAAAQTILSGDIGKSMFARSNPT